MQRPGRANRWPGRLLSPVSGTLSMVGPSLGWLGLRIQSFLIDRHPRPTGHAQMQSLATRTERQKADAQEDETFGQDKRGDEMPDWAGDKQKQLAKIQQAMAALEADARLAAEEERRIEAEKEQQRQAEGRKKPGKPAAPPSDQPDPKSQRNFTDSGSLIMKSKDAFVQAYNAQGRR